MTVFVKLNLSDIQSGEYARNLHRVNPEAGLPYEVVFAPTFWSNVAQKMRAGDLVEVLPKDQAYYAELIVLDVGPKADQIGAPYAKVFELRKVDLTKSKTERFLEDASTFKTKFRGPKRWSVIRIDSSAVVKEDLATEGEAIEWIKANSKPGTYKAPAETAEAA